jgi:acetyl-CoA C-acetyltransferase
VSLDPDRTPVIVATGQTESRDLSLGPVELAEAAAAGALSAAPGLGKRLERLTLVNILSRRAGIAPASVVAAALGLGDVARETTSIGGNTPQAMVERAAADIAAGRLQATLIVGAEAVRSGKLKPAGVAAEPATAQPSGTTSPPPLTSPPPTTSLPPLTPPPPPEPSEPDPVVGIDGQDLSDEERMAGFFIPVHVYPLFESVLASRAGRTPAEQRAYIGRLMAPFTEVAAAHRHAWFREVMRAEEMSTPGPSNRLVVEPYVKRMVAFLGGAQAAALAVTSLSVARDLGLADGAMFIWGAASAHDVWSPMARPDLGKSVGVEVAGKAALAAAGVGVGDVGLFDLYSCFPSAVQMAAAALGLDLDLDKPSPVGRFTVTGGLPYFGGPGNNYTTHAIATMFDLLRQGSGASLALVTAVGWYMTKHSVGVYGSTPPPQGYRRADTTAAQDQINATAVACVKAGDPVESHATVEASAVFYDRDGAAVAAPLIATLDDGRRVAASAAEGEVEAVAGKFLVGATVAVTSPPAAQAAPEYRLVG